MNKNKSSFSVFFLLAALVLAVSTTACTEAERARHTSLGSKATITCYSGGKEIFSDRSTGRVQTDEKGAGVYYKSANSGQLVHTYADCIVQFED